MSSGFRRYAVYYAPPPGADWTRFCTGWLGWDMELGHPAPRPDLPALPMPLDEITNDPRRYGLHGTLKPPFALAKDTTRDELAAACETLAASQPRIAFDGLRLARLGRFLALRPEGDEAPLSALAAACVRELDRFRAPAGEAELARRRQSGLTPAQDENLQRWGYPYVMEQFRFHITLSGRLPGPALEQVEAILSDHLEPILPRPFEIADIALVGEQDSGRFRLLGRYPLAKPFTA